MTALFTIGLVLIILFGFSVGAYIACYKLNIESAVAKTMAAVVLGGIVSVVTFTISLTLIWPPVM